MPESVDIRDALVRAQAQRAAAPKAARERCRRAAIALALAAVLPAQVLVAAEDPAAGPVALDALDWRAAANGVRTAVLLGNPVQAGAYALRAKLPPNWRVAPHTHPEDARLTTVISGTLYWAAGDTFDEAKLQALGPGAVIIEPRGVAHYALTREQGAELQVTSIGPAGMSFVTPRE